MLLDFTPTNYLNHELTDPEDLTDPDLTKKNLTNDDFHAGALVRIQRGMITMALVFSSAAVICFGWQSAAGFACGCGVGYLNFHLLKKVVDGVVERTVATGYRQSGKGIILRFMLRYLAVACAAYVILTSYRASLHGFLIGLFLPVAAILFEATYELFMAVARGILMD